jgi:hypothetical protein
MRGRFGGLATERLDASGGTVWRPALYLGAGARIALWSHLGVLLGLDIIRDIRYSTVTLNAGLTLGSR